MSTKNEEASPADKAKQDAMFEEQEPKKIIRIITVTAYMISVSFVGIALSGYYIFLWHPPNPRLMHSHAPMHERLVHEDGAREAGVARMVGQPESFDLLAAAQQPDAHGSKARRQIVNNANVILRADFEKNKEATAPPLSALPSLNQSIVTNSTVSPVSISNSTSPNSEPLLSISSTDENEQMKSTSAASEESNVSAIPVSTLVSSTRRSKSFGKKHHQTPFALKHLEVPIKSDGQRKRPVRISTTLTTTTSSTVGRSVIPSYVQDFAADSSTAGLADVPGPSASPHRTKNLFEMLTSRPSLRELDYATDVPMEPSADGFQPDYRDSTTELPEDLLDD